MEMSDFGKYTDSGRLGAYFDCGLPKKTAAGGVAENLRAFVRERVHKEGALYRRGAARALAKYLGRPESWVSHYIDDDNGERRHADIDTALAICEFYDVNLLAFRKGQPKVITAPPLTAEQVEAAKIAAMWLRKSASVQAAARTLLLAAVDDPEKTRQSSAAPPLADRLLTAENAPARRKRVR
jgi:hypothetical protein